MATKKQLEQVLSELEHVGPSRRAEALRTYLRLVRPVVAVCMPCCCVLSMDLAVPVRTRACTGCHGLQACSACSACSCGGCALPGFPSFACVMGLPHNLHTACLQVRELKVRDSENVTTLGEELLRKHRSQLGGEEREHPRLELGRQLLQPPLSKQTHIYSSLIPLILCTELILLTTALLLTQASPAVATYKLIRLRALHRGARASVGLQ